MISIIVPTRNRAHLLARALTSIQSQSFTDYEVWVVDDASEAATREAYGPLWAQLDSRFKLMSLGNPAHLKGVGPSASRNLGLAAASGSIIAFCDDDDFWLDDTHLTTLATVFASQPEVGMYIANQRAVSVDGVVRSDWLPGLSERAAALPAAVGGGFVVTLDELVRCGGFAHLNMLSVRRSVVDHVRGFWESVSYEEDRDFFWRCADVCPFVVFNPAIVAQHNVPNPQLKVNASTTHSQRDRWLLAALVCQHIALSVQHQSIAKLALQLEGDLMRRLAQYAVHEAKPALALSWAQQALALRFSFKWAVYCVWLRVKKRLAPSTSGPCP